MFDLIIMLSRYLFIFYIVLFLWQGIVYVAYEQGGFLGNPYTAVSMQRRITVLMHMTAFLILGYNRETYMFDITTLLFGAISLVFLLFAVKLLDRFYYEGCPLIWTGMLFLMDVSLIILQRVEPSLAHRQLMWMCIGLAGMSFLPTFQGLKCLNGCISSGAICCCFRQGFSACQNTALPTGLPLARLPFSPRRLQSFCLYSTLRAYSARGWNGSSF